MDSAWEEEYATGVRMRAGRSRAGEVVLEDVSDLALNGLGTRNIFFAAGRFKEVALGF